MQWTGFIWLAVTSHIYVFRLSIRPNSNKKNHSTCSPLPHRSATINYIDSNRTGNWMECCLFEFPICTISIVNMQSFFPILCNHTGRNISICTIVTVPHILTHISSQNSLSVLNCVREYERLGRYFLLSIVKSTLNILYCSWLFIDKQLYGRIDHQQSDRQAGSQTPTRPFHPLPSPPFVIIILHLIYRYFSLIKCCVYALCMWRLNTMATFPIHAMFNSTQNNKSHLSNIFAWQILNGKNKITKQNRWTCTKMLMSIQIEIGVSVIFFFSLVVFCVVVGVVVVFAVFFFVRVYLHRITNCSTLYMDYLIRDKF